MVRDAPTGPREARPDDKLRRAPHHEATATHSRSRCAKCARVCPNIVPQQKRAQCYPKRGAGYPKRGAGKAGCPLHPRPRVRNETSTRVSHHRFTGITRPSLRNSFNGFFYALPGDRAFLPPSPPRSLLLENLTPASGCQDHAASPSASRALVSRAPRVHHIPRPTSVTIAIRPLRERDGDDVEVIWV
jgi:hypothetical protein